MSGQSGLSAFYQAVVEENDARVRELAGAGERVAWEGEPFDDSALHLAAAKGRADTVQVLLRAGGAAFVNAFSQLHETPLGAAARNGHAAAASVLLDAGAEIDAHDQAAVGNTPLAEAVDAGAEEVVMLLLRGGADPTISGWMGLNAVQRAEARYRKDGSEAARRIFDAVRSAARKSPRG